MSKKCNVDLCGTELSFAEIINALIVKDKTTGCYYLNTTVTESSDCDNFEGLPCGTFITEKEALKMILGVDDCGRTAINILRIV
jgi:hypothetical protein